MKNLTIAYDTMQNGEVGEACVWRYGRVAFMASGGVYVAGRC